MMCSGLERWKDNVDLDWREEGKRIIEELREHVCNLTISEKLESSRNCVYLNLTTLEGEKWCICLSVNGFKIVSNQHDTSNQEGSYFETPYSLLNSVSQKYRNSIANSIIRKLNELYESEDQPGKGTE